MNQRDSIDERRRLVAQSLQVGNPGNNARDLPGPADPYAEQQIELPIDEIRPYEHNPRAVQKTSSSTTSRSRSAPADSGRR
jgi:hypothetical protein